MTHFLHSPRIGRARPWAKLERLTRALPLIASLLLVLPTLARAQDSVAVVDRGVPRIRLWDVAEFPFRVIQVPLLAFGAGVQWVARQAEAGHWIPLAVYYHEWLGDRGIHPSFEGQGAHSGPGIKLSLGTLQGEGSTLWGHVRGGITLNEYWEVQARAGAGRSGGLARAQLLGGIERRAEDEFFGIGNDSREEDRSDFELKRYSVGGHLTMDATRRLSASLTADWSQVETGPGNDGGLPDADSIFEPSEAPGLGLEQRYVSVGGSAGWKLGGRHATLRQGYWAHVGYRWYESLIEADADFGKVAVNVGLEFPFDYRRRSLAFALYYEALRESGGGTVPFYHLPTLGGRGTLPAFRLERFRDRDLILGGVEYRYRAWSDPGDAIWLDGALFFYEGMVAANLAEDFKLSRLHSSYGFALSLINRESAIARIEVALGGEEFAVIVSFGAGS